MTRLIPVLGSRRMDALAARPPRRRPWRLRVAALISVLIHVAIGVMLLVTIRHRTGPELLPPPSEVTMLFDSGRKGGPTLPDPGLQASPPPSPEAAPAPATPLPTPPVPPSQAPPAPPPPPAPPALPVPEPAPPVPKEPSPPAATQAQPAPPQVEIPPPPPPALEPAPLSPPPPPAPARPAAAPKPPQPRPPPRPAAPRKESDFPAPMDFSFGKPLAAPKTQAQAQPRSSPHFPGTIDMSLGPAAKGVENRTPYSDSDEGREGADYRNALSRWVAEHAYYPEQARRDGDEGDATVHVIASADGRVREVLLMSKSGSMWLDLALQSLFRDQHIPPYPGGGSEPIEFNFTMHYVLIRR